MNFVEALCTRILKFWVQKETSFTSLFDEFYEIPACSGSQPQPASLSPASSAEILHHFETFSGCRHGWLFLCFGSLRCLLSASQNRTCERPSLVLSSHLLAS